jgi:sugar lactone lactonase YvrE
MKKRFFLLSLMIVFLFAASCQGTEALEAEAVETEALEAELVEIEATEAEPVEAEEVLETAVTNIVIDGDASDWGSQYKTFSDPEGDAEEGFLDLGDGQLFVNHNALYFKVDLFDSNMPFVHFDIQFFADDRLLQISWVPQNEFGFLGDYTDKPIQIGEATRSTFAFNTSLEGRIDLEDIGNPGKIEFYTINVMAGEDAKGTWRAVENWMPDSTPVVDELDASEHAMLTAQAEDTTSTEEVNNKDLPVTNIIIDGEPDDWKGRDIDVGDAEGDNENGYLDLSTGYSFANKDALYFMVEVVDSAAPFVQFDIIFAKGSNEYRISWSTGETAARIIDSIAQKQVGNIEGSVFAYRDVLEGRIDFRDLDVEGTASIKEINVMVGDQDSWRAEDTWQPISTIQVEEIDPPRMVSNEQKYILARRWETPEDYIGEILQAPPIPDICYIAQSENGLIFLQQCELNHGISTLDLTTGKVNRILDFPIENTYHIVAGPDDSIFIGVGNEILQVFSDGETQTWGILENGWPAVFDGQDSFYGRSYDGTQVMRLYSNGSGEVVASGFSRVNDVVIDDQGRLFVSDNQTGVIARINLDGSVTTLASGLIVNDVVDIDLDSNGNIIVMTYVKGLDRMDPETGNYLDRFGGTGGDLVVTKDNYAILANGTQSQVYRRDLTDGMTELIIANGGLYTHAVEVGPDDILYVGTWANGDSPGQIVQFKDDGASEVIVDNLPGNPVDLVFDKQGGIYIATNQEHLIYQNVDGSDLVEIPGVEAGIRSITIDPISGVLLAGIWRGRIVEYDINGFVQEHKIKFPEPVEEFYIDYGPDGSLYAYASERARHFTGPEVKRWILKIDLKKGSSEVYNQYNHVGCCTLGNFSVDNNGEIWWTVDPEFELHRIDQDGNRILFANHIPTDAVGVGADNQGDVYFSGASGIIRLFKDE